MPQLLFQNLVDHQFGCNLTNQQCLVGIRQITRTNQQCLLRDVSDSKEGSRNSTNYKDEPAMYVSDQTWFSHWDLARLAVRIFMLGDVAGEGIAL